MTRPMMGAAGRSFQKGDAGGDEERSGRGKNGLAWTKRSPAETRRQLGNREEVSGRKSTTAAEVLRSCKDPATRRAYCSLLLDWFPFAQRQQASRLGLWSVCSCLSDERVKKQKQGRLPKIKTTVVRLVVHARHQSVTDQGASSSIM
jgi:hypothetical protein